MEFSIDNYQVISDVCDTGGFIFISFSHRGGSNLINVKIPEDLFHPSLKGALEAKLSSLVLKASRKRNASSVSRYIPPRSNTIKLSVRKFITEFEQVYGDIEDYKDSWDYALAPKGTVTKGKYGDLKAFLSMRKGCKLEL